MNAHTPGPWRVGDAGGTVFGPPKQPTLKRIATVSSSPIVSDERKANARLIAAAPELLEACKLAFQRLQPGDIRKDYSGHVAHVAMDKAIAKAEGRL